MTVRLGTTWYPDQTPREEWRSDVELMRQLGMSVVRLGEFAWSALQPDGGDIGLRLLDDALEVLDAAGLEVVLCTPTAEPPAWLVAAAPDVTRVGPDGRRATFAMESRSCLSSPALLEAVDEIVGALAHRYGHDERVIGWQIDNELSTPCFCDRCAEEFRAWLQPRYGTLDELNRRWGTAFRSERYDDWSQIPLVSPQVPYLNPALGLDRRRFHSDTFVAFNARQAAILREQSAPGTFITHNTIPPALATDIDYGRLAADLDVVGWDHYPSLETPPRPWRSAFEADLVRTLKDAPFWVLEMQTDAIGLERLASPEPGQVRAWSYQAVAHGAETLLFFRWRTARFGAEQHWGGVLEPSGRRGEGFANVEQIGGELRELGARIEGLRPRVQAALVHDYDARWALEEQPTNDALPYVDTLLRHHRSLAGLCVATDVVAPGADLSGVRLVAAPGLYVVDDATVAWLRDFAERGGTVVLAPRAGFKDRDNAIADRPVEALAGVEVSAVRSADPDEQVSFAGRLSGAGHGWSERLELRGAEALATFTDGPFAAAPAVTRHAVGAGAVVYVATALTDASAAELYGELAPDAGLDVLDLPDGVEGVRCRNAGGDDLLVVIEHSGSEQAICATERTWSLDGAVDGATLRLPPYGVAIGAR